MFVRDGQETKMTGPEVLDVGRDAIVTLLKVSAPLLLCGLIVGVVISLFQALTQIQEMTLVFVPKIIAMFVVLVLALPFMGDVLSAHMNRIRRADASSPEWLPVFRQGHAQTEHVPEKWLPVFR